MKTEPTIYAVYWPTLNVFKIGFSERKRWRSFLNRGAELLLLKTDFAGLSQAFDFEAACHLVANEVCRPGFESAEDAHPYLGNQGGGYKECYRVPADLMPSEILAFIDSRLAVFHAQA
jgi:hypothetical protein